MAQNADSCAEWAGATGTLSELAHNVAGQVTLKADCTFLLTGFSYDGLGPATWWAIESGSDPSVIGDASQQIQVSALTPGVSFDEECSAQITKSDFSWGDVAGDSDQLTIGLWCRTAKQLFGAVVLTKPAVLVQNIGAAVCSSCEEWAGATGTLTELAHGVSGQLTIKSDCTFQLDSFSYDGLGPATWWAIESGADQASIGDASFQVQDSAVLMGTSFSNECSAEVTKDGFEWSDAVGDADQITIGMWCRVAKQLFGSVTLTKPTAQFELLPAVCDAPTSCEEWAGATGTLSELAHGVKGQLTIKADCTFLLSSFSYDGQGPATSWVIESGNDVNALDGDSELLQSSKLVFGTAFDNECSAEVTKTGFQWSDAVGDADQISIGLWCDQAKQLFGGVVLTKPSTVAQNIEPAVCGASPAGPSSCEEWAGATGTLTGLAHGVEGQLTIKADCTFLLSGFSYDGAGPSTAWVIESGNDFMTLDTDSELLQSSKLVMGTAFDNECSAEVTKTGFQWSDAVGDADQISIGLWCDVAKQLFGYVVLTKPATVVAGALAAKCTNACETWAGATGTLTGFAHGVEGDLTLKADCTFLLSSFSYDGLGPATSWVIESGADLNALDGDSELLQSSQLVMGTAFDNECSAEVTKTGFQWSDAVGDADQISIGLWCNVAKQLFGGVVLTKPSVALENIPRAVCASSCEAWAGATGTLSELAHNVKGQLTIKADCTFLLDAYSYDGGGPQTFWVIESGSDESVISEDSVHLQDNRVTMAYNEECSAQTTKDDFEWSDVVGDSNQIVIGMWCNTAKQLFGAVTLTKPATPVAGILPASCAAGARCPDETPDCLNNCMSLDTYFNVWWETDGTDIVMELQAAVDDEDTWVGFGIADSENYGMIGSDITITGFHNGVAAAQDYYLERKGQCNYNGDADQGVCPDDNMASCAGLADGETGSNDVQFISGSVSGGIQRIRFKRPLTPTDPCDRAFEVDSRVVWATGPITQGSPQLVVNVHEIPNIPTVGGHSPFPGVDDASTRFNALANPGIAPGCFAFLAKGSTEPVECVRRELIEDETTLDVVVENISGPHPAPPGWGVAWRVQGNEFAEIIVERGTTYTFNVRSTEFHPFYITDNAVGGRANPNEPVFAGGADAFTTEGGDPFVVEWTPDENTPDMVFYQCWTHQKLGWRIYVIDAGTADQFLPPLDTATRCPGDEVPTLAPEASANSNSTSESEVEADSASSTIEITKIAIVLTTIIMLF